MENVVGQAGISLYRAALVKLTVATRTYLVRSGISWWFPPCGYLDVGDLMQATVSAPVLAPQRKNSELSNRLRERQGVTDQRVSQPAADKAVGLKVSRG